MSPNENLERLFPNLEKSRYKITSPPTLMYNCAAWAAGQSNGWWWPVEEVGCYWPSDAPFIETLEAFQKAFETLGYSLCAGDTAEAGCEKIAIYANEQDTPTHVARQLETGAWTSKIGEYEDIEHELLSALEGKIYGKVAQVMQRTRISQTHPQFGSTQGRDT